VTKFLTLLALVSNIGTGAFFYWKGKNDIEILCPKKAQDERLASAHYDGRNVKCFYAPVTAKRMQPGSLHPQKRTAP